MATGLLAAATVVVAMVLARKEVRRVRHVLGDGLQAVLDTPSEHGPAGDAGPDPACALVEARSAAEEP